MNPRRTEVGNAIRRALDHLFPNSLELAAPDVGEIPASRTLGGAIVQEDRDLQLFSHAFTELFGEDDAILHRRALEGNERDDVGRPHAGMLAAVRVEIDPVARGANSGEGRV